MLTYEERDAMGYDVVGNLGANLKSIGQPHEEVVCVLLHALRLAEKLSASTHARGLRPSYVPQAPEVIADCKAELQRRAG